MASKKLRPSPDLLFQLESTFLANGYRALTMEKLAESCNFSRRALYFYFFGSKAEAFRAVIRFRNEVAPSTSFAAGRRLWADGDHALDILAEIINIRYRDTRRFANASPHVVELNAEVFTRCIDIVQDVALIFEADLAKLILELQGGNASSQGCDGQTIGAGARQRRARRQSTPAAGRAGRPDRPLP